MHWPKFGIDHALTYLFDDSLFVVLRVHHLWSMLFATGYPSLILINRTVVIPLPLTCT